MLTLAHPWLLAVLPLPLVVHWLAPPYRAQHESLRVPFLPRLIRLTLEPARGGGVARRGWRRSLALWSVWLCTVAALVRPQWLEPPVTKSVPVRDVLLAVDLSASMQTKDFTDAAGKTVDRLTAVKQVLDEFLSRRKGDRVGLLVFGNAPFVQAPFTQDLDVCRRLLAEMQVGMAGPRTAWGDAVGLAIGVFDRSQVAEKELIVLTDGNDTASQVPPEKAAAVAKDKQIVIHTVAVGDPKAAGEEKLDEATLRRVAAETGGTYSHAGDRRELEAIYARLDKLPTRPATTLTHRAQHELYVWPLGVGLIFSLLAQAVLLVVDWATLRAESHHITKAA